MSEYEQKRVQALHDLAILDTPSNPILNDLVNLAAAICETQISAVSLVDSNRQWFLAERGLDVKETSREVSFCTHAIAGHGFYEIADASTHPSFRSNPLVVGPPFIRYYFGVPLRIGSGFNIGTLCVLDRHPKQLTLLQKEALEIISRLVIDQIERYRTERRRREIETTYDSRRVRTLGTSKMATLGEMAGGIAHEINNPLTTIMTRAGTLIEWSETGTLDQLKVRELAGAIEKTGIRIAKTVRALRAFSRDGENDPLEATQLAKIFEDTLELCNERMHQNEINLMVDLPSPEIVVECRSVQISQVLLNLLNNSFDAISELSVSERWIRLNYSVQDGSCKVSVVNGGPKIDPAISEHIMRPFFTTKPAGKGTGLGLSISQRILHAHGGQIEMNPYGDHTCFFFSLKLV